MTTPNKCSSCDNVATIQISHCNTKYKLNKYTLDEDVYIKAVEKGKHFNYYCDNHYFNNQKTMPYPHFITDIGIRI